MAGGKKPTLLGVALPDDLVTREHVLLRRSQQRWMRAGLLVALGGIVLTVVQCMEGLR